MKTRTRRKLFKCLEPLVGTNVPGKSKRSGAGGTEMDGYSYGSDGGGGSGSDVIAGLFKISSSFGDRKFESPDGGFAKESREKSGRSFSRVIKSVLFEKSLMRKFRKKGSSPSISAPSTSCDSSRETDHKMRKGKRLSKERWDTDESLGGNTSDSSDTSLFSSSTTASTSGKSSRSASDRKIPSPRPLIINFIDPKQASLVNEEASFRGHFVLKPPKPTTAVKEPFSLKPARTVTRTTAVTKRYNNNSNVMWLYIVISLMALVFWGKTLAILCTSAWLYMVPRFSHSPEIHSDEVYWSKIVKERMSEQTSLSRRRLGASN